MKLKNKANDVIDFTAVFDYNFELSLIKAREFTCNLR